MIFDFFQVGHRNTRDLGGFNFLSITSIFSDNSGELKIDLEIQFIIPNSIPKCNFDDIGLHYTLNAICHARYKDTKRNLKIVTDF